MEEIDWSKAPDWAEYVVIGPLSKGKYWANDDMRQQFGGSYVYRVGAGVTSHVDERWGRIDRTSTWKGTGLPPVGTVCEVENEELGGWDEVDSILAHAVVLGSSVAVFQIGNRIAYAKAASFRPIRTPEQIAAEAREKAIQQCAKELHAARGELTDISHSLIVAAWLFDNGYRKTTNQPQEDK